METKLLSILLAAMGALSPMTARAQPVVVELFTSQGCSSCPPADALLGEVARKPNVIALAYHVDYWDDLGWKDPFSIPEAAQRQRGYVRRLAKSGAFTPQAVVSGDTSLVGSNRAMLYRAMRRASSCCCSGRIRERSRVRTGSCCASRRCARLVLLRLAVPGAHMCAHITCSTLIRCRKV